MPPAKLFMRLGRIPNQKIDFSRAKIRRINPHQNLTAALIDPGLGDSLAAPFDSPIDFAKSRLDKFTHRMCLSGGQDEIARLLLLDDPIDAVDKIARVAPIPLGVQIAEISRLPRYNELCWPSAIDATARVILRVTKVSPRRGLS
jgi:hypothetical protein